MRYYCSKCKVEISFKDHEYGSYAGDCIICGDGPFSSAPDYETPDQYEKRTGKKLPIKTAVWILNGDGEWELYYYCEAIKRCYAIIVCANGPEPPPYDYCSEEDLG